MCSEADFIKFDSNIDDGYGPRYLKFSDEKKEHEILNCKKYFGEWDPKSKKPHGRGIRIYPKGVIQIGYWKYGQVAAGNFINI
jgi:hypothetical protein